MKYLIHAILLYFIYIPALLAQNIVVLSDTANELTLQTTTKYIFGDNDSLIDARNIAQYQAKRLAAERAGSYIHAEKIIENDMIKSNTISTVSSALLSLEITDESMRILPGSKTELTLSCKITIDKKSLFKKLDSLKGSSEKQKRIAVLEKENGQLLLQLEQLNDELHQTSKTKNTTLTNERDVVLKKLTSNEQTILKTFKAGDLLKLANKGSDAYKLAENDINQNVFEYIKKETTITLGEPLVSENVNGSYNVQLAVSWKIDWYKMLQTLEKYFRVSRVDPVLASIIPLADKNTNRITVSGYNNKNTNNQPYLEKLFRYYSKQYAYIEVSVGPYTRKRMIMGSKQAVSKDVATEIDGTQAIRWTSTYMTKRNDVTNKLIFSNLSKKDLASIDEITSKVIFKDKVPLYLISGKPYRANYLQGKKREKDWQ